MSQIFRTFVLCKGTGDGGPWNVEQRTEQYDAEAYATGSKGRFHTSRHQRVHVAPTGTK